MSAPEPHNWSFKMRQTQYPFLTASRACEYLNVSRQRLLSLTVAGYLESDISPDGRSLWSRETLDKFKAEMSKEFR